MDGFIVGDVTIVGTGIVFGMDVGAGLGIAIGVVFRNSLTRPIFPSAPTASVVPSEDRPMDQPK